MLARAQFTVRDENDVTISVTAPATPVIDELWLDTSATPHLLKRWNGTAWISCSAEPTQNDVIVGTQTVGTASWTGVASFATLRDGQEIAYWLPQASGAAVTLTLTLSDGTQTEAIPCYYSSSTRLGTQYSAGNILHLTYRENVTIYNLTIAKGWWADANTDTNYYDRIRIGGSIKAKTAIMAGRLVVGDSSGYFHIAAGTPFDVTRSILYALAALPIGVFGMNFYLSYPSCYLRNIIPTFTGTNNAAVYLIGTLEGSMFTPATDFLTTTIPTQEDGFTYLSLGIMTSAFQCCLYPEHPMYRFVGGAFKSLGQVAYEAHLEAEDLQTDLATAIEQTDAAIALKADLTVTDGLGNRLDTAEATLTTQATQIASVVTQSQNTTNTLNALTIGGRNYVRNSQATLELNNSSETFTSVWLTPAPIMSDDYLNDCKGKSITISYWAMCENLERATTGSWIGMQITYNTETSGSYVYNAMTVTTPLGSGTRAWSRYRLTTTIPSSAISVRATMLTIQNCKGIVRLRNMQVECGNRMTDYRPAPEDIALRMTNAESSITQQAAQIALKVNSATYAAEKVYRGTTAPSSPSVDMLWLDTALTPNILKRYTGSTWVAMGAEELKTSGITISPNNVAITTEQFLLQLLDPQNNENVLLEMSASGNVGFRELYADEIISGSIASAYHGPTSLYVVPTYTGSSITYFRSLSDLVQTLNDRFLTTNVTVYLPSASGETYDPAGVSIRGITGPGKLTIFGYSSNILCTYLTITGCSASIVLQNVRLREYRPLTPSNTRNSYLIDCRMNHYVELAGCTLDANSTTYDSIYCRSSQLFVTTTGFYNAIQGLECYAATAAVYNCKGSCSWAMVSYIGYIIAHGTVPGGSRGTGMNGQLFAANVTVDYGTAIPPTTPTETTLQYATLTRSWKGSWRTDTLDIVQGLYSDSGYNSSLYWNRGCIWFGNLRNVLTSDVTIMSASLTLYRKTGSGSSSAKTVYLCAITNATASGTPMIAANYGALGVIGRAQQLTFSIPVAAVQGLASGTYGGLALFESSYNFGSANWSDSYMRMAGTDSSYNAYLQVVYSGSTAQG